MSSYKTTITGIIAILGGIVTILEALRNGHLDANVLTGALTGITGGAGLLFARDHKVSDEQAGATTPSSTPTK